MTEEEAQQAVKLLQDFEDVIRRAKELKFMEGLFNTDDPSCLKDVPEPYKSQLKDLHTSINSLILDL